MAGKFNFKEKEKIAEIKIYGGIGYNNLWGGDGTNNQATHIINQIEEFSKKAEQIHVHINSPGGDVATGLAIYNALQNSKAEIHTFNDGFVGSMASIIMLAGITHFPKTSVYHLHSASTWTYGNAKVHEESIKALNVFEVALKEALVAKTGMTAEEITDKWFDGGEHYFSAKELTALNIADVIEDYSVKAPDVSNLNYGQIAAMYQAKQKPSLVEKFLNFFNATEENVNPINKPEMKKIKAFTALLVLLSFEAFNMNAEGNIEIDHEAMQKLNDALQTRDAQIANLTAERDAAIALADEARAALDQEPGTPPATVKAETAPDPGKLQIQKIDQKLRAEIRAMSAKNLR
jgi:ATP-dependent protease ClpP protease subunit